MKRAILGIVALGLTILIVFTSLNSGETYSGAAGVVGPWVNDHIFFGRLNADEVKALVTFGSKFFGHFSLFALTGVFVYLFLKECLKKKTAWVIFFVYGVFLSSMGEVIQIFVAGRSPTVVDSFIDLSGYVLIPLLIAFYRRLIIGPVDSAVAPGEDVVEHDR